MTEIQQERSGPHQWQRQGSQPGWPQWSHFSSWVQSLLPRTTSPVYHALHYQIRLLASHSAEWRKTAGVCLLQSRISPNLDWKELMLCWKSGEERGPFQSQMPWQEPCCSTQNVIRTHTVHCPSYRQLFCKCQRSERKVLNKENPFAQNICHHSYNWALRPQFHCLHLTFPGNFLFQLVSWLEHYSFELKHLPFFN